jgi:hypothetical protein
METEQVDLMRSMVIVLRQAIRLREQLDVTKEQMSEMQKFNNVAVEKLMSQLKAKELNTLIAGSVIKGSGA